MRHVKVGDSAMDHEGRRVVVVDKVHSKMTRSWYLSWGYVYEDFQSLMHDADWSRFSWNILDQHGTMASFIASYAEGHRLAVSGGYNQDYLLCLASELDEVENEFGLVCP